MSKRFVSMVRAFRATTLITFVLLHTACAHRAAELTLSGSPVVTPHGPGAVAPTPPISSGTGNQQNSQPVVPSPVARSAPPQIPPLPGQYIAFSMREAESRLRSTHGSSGPRDPDLFGLGGLNHLTGAVYDIAADDVILVGRHSPDRAPLTIDDFAVTMRALVVNGAWPTVSIDQQDQSFEGPVQPVRFGGGIDDTQFGADLLDADIRLKHIGMGTLASGVDSLRTFWDLVFVDAAGSGDMVSRFWFYPIVPNVYIKSGLVAIDGLEVGVRSETHPGNRESRPQASSGPGPAAAQRFANGVTEAFQSLARIHPSFARVQSLQEMVAVGHALAEMSPRPNLDFWLKEYDVEFIDTPPTVPMFNRVEGMRHMTGGVKMFALAVRLKEGDVTALREAVLLTRPQKRALTWGFIVRDWIMPIAGKEASRAVIAAMIVDALNEQEQKRYDNAIALYDALLARAPDMIELLNNRAAAYADKGNFSHACADLEKAIKVAPENAILYNNLGLFLTASGDPRGGIRELSKAIRLNRRYAEAFTNRGDAHAALGDWSQAITDYTSAVRISPDHERALFNRADCYARMGEDDRAFADYDRLVAKNPLAFEALNQRALLKMHQGRLDEAVEDLTRAINASPSAPNALKTNRDLMLRQLGR